MVFHFSFVEHLTPDKGIYSETTTAIPIYNFMERFTWTSAGKIMTVPSLILVLMTSDEITLKHFTENAQCTLYIFNALWRPRTTPNWSAIHWVLRLFVRALVLMCVAGLRNPQRYVLTVCFKSCVFPPLGSKERDQSQCNFVKKGILHK